MLLADLLTIFLIKILMEEKVNKEVFVIAQNKWQFNLFIKSDNIVHWQWAGLISYMTVDCWG